MKFQTSFLYQKTFIIILVVGVLSFTTSKSQKKELIAASPLSYHWLIDQTKSIPDPILYLKNTSQEELHKTGWIIYFNCIKKPYIVGADTATFTIKPINGDFYSLISTKENFTLKPGEEVGLHITVPEIRNFTEVPSGFYIVYDVNPLKGFSLKNVTPVNDFVEPSIAYTSYQKNAQIEKVAKDKLPVIFPTPVSVIKNKGTFIISSKTAVIFPPKYKNEGSLFVKELGEILNAKPALSESYQPGAIQLIDGDAPDGGYILKSTSKGITITASGTEGMFYGIQSLKTLLPAKVWAAKQTSITIPAVEIEDAPRFPYRSLLLDVTRNFQPKEKIKKIIDLLALYKLNVLHLHMTDDEGWRLEIPGLPELTKIGAVRSHSLDSKNSLPPSYNSGPDSNNHFGSGYYSKGDFIELLKYATQRHIKIIPEVESPGHARAAIKSMDYRYTYYMQKGLKSDAEEYLLRDLSDSSVYHSVQGWTDNVMNVALPSTYRFIRKVTKEIVKMYAEASAPLETIHMGGDEVPEGVWEKSPAIKQLLAKDTTIKSVTNFWKYYYTQVNEILKENNLYLYGWEEAGLKKTYVNGRKKMVVDTSVSERNYHVDVWNNIIGTGQEDLAYRLANNNFKVMLTNVTNMYFDMAYNKSFNEHGMNWGGFVDVDKPFYFIPFNYYQTTTEDEYGRTVSPDVFKNKVALEETAQKNIIGLQGALWSETIGKEGTLEYLLLPKLLGLAERAWSKDPGWSSETNSVLQSDLYKKDYSAFINKIGMDELSRLDNYKGGYNYRIPEPGVESSEGLIRANSMFPGFTIKYTTDGSEPGINSPVYTHPIKTKGTITLKVFNKKGRSGKKVIIVNK